MNMLTSTDGLTTVIGAQGFIGRHIVSKLRSRKMACFTPDRDDPAVFMKPLGRVLFCAGVTSDFRQRPFDTMRAHVSLAGELLEKAEFDSFVYLSSTRLYLDCPLAHEQAVFTVDPARPDHLFHLSKLAGESLCMNAGRANVSIARIANVCGDDYSSGNFLYSLIRDAVDKGTLTLHTTLDSAKDYIGVDDVAELLLRISQAGGSGIYNVASGINTTNGSLMQWISELTGCQAAVADHATSVTFPPINISRIQEEFGYEQPDCEALIRGVIQSYVERGKGGVEE